ncbi:response regulator [bacterium]|nr:response regulator [bacterium]
MKGNGLFKFAAVKVQCAIVSSEVLITELFKNYLGRLGGFELAAQLKDVPSIAKLPESQPIDLLFLDLESQNAGALDQLYALENPPLTILSTSSQEYALVGYQLGLVDYLLKPVSFERFSKATEKAQTLLNPRLANAGAGLGEGLESALKQLVAPNYLFIKVDYKIIKIYFSDILYIESMREYVRIHTENERHITLISLSRMKAFLPENKFVQIHRSTLINLDKLSQIQGNTAYLGATELSISKSFKDDLMGRIATSAIFS